MIRRVLIVLMIMLTTIGSAEACLTAHVSAATGQIELLDESEPFSDQADLDLGHAHDGDPWIRRPASGASPRTWHMSDVNFHPALPPLLEGRMSAPMHRPPIGNRIAFSSDPSAVSSPTTT